MENISLHNQKNFTQKRSVSAIRTAFAIAAFSTLSLIASGCSNGLLNATAPSANSSAMTDKADNKNTNSDFKAADDSTSTAAGIAQVVNANNKFAISLYQQLHAQPDQADSNVFFSPYSLSSAMAMLYAAAQGKTQQQIKDTFNYPALATLNPNSAALYNQFNSPNPDYILTTINDLWMQQGRSPKQDYLNTVQRYYGGQVTELDFNNRPEPSRQQINQTISEYTKQMIAELLPNGSITSDTSTVLTNAVYFKGDWQSAFNGSKDYLFNNIDGTTSTIDMMYQLDSFNYTEDQQVQVLELPYKGDDLSMLVVLPKSKDKSALQTLVKNLSSTQITQWTDKLEQKEVMLDLPKFTLKQSYKMKPILADMGMPIAFGNQADFSLFNEDLPLSVSDIFHEAVIEVDEKGTVAAAATGSVVTVVSARYEAEFLANHPFMFIIKDNQSDAILFLGQVNKL
ncbi:serpin family protein [Psychrobacter jeotgali]|uniref:serpin family protein n=1 Tax=Psychrobacter jeotgali TaxID=179010 RepID=UPI00191B1C1E|nr:serpin family protein [Psychrobacter jeotgali]